MNAGALSWPSLRVNSEGLGRYLDERACSDEQVTPSIARDLFLAFACLSEASNAVEAFQADYRPIVSATAQRFDGSGHLAEELWQQLARTWFVKDGDRVPRIGAYHGRGPLSAWVRTCAKRAAIRMVKPKTSEVLMTHEALAEELTEACDQELVLLKNHYAELFRQELLGALGELPGRDRTLLQLHLIAGLSTTRIAEMYQVNQSTISRQLQRTAANIFGRLKQRVHARLGVATAELEALIDLARSQIEFTLSSLDDMLTGDSGAA